VRAKKFTSEGIVISRKNYSEADRILVIYTNDYGKLFVMAKGVRKLKSKKRGHLEVFSHIKFSASKGSGIDVMTEVESINDFHKIKKDLKKVALAYYFMEVVFKLTSQEEKNKELFRLILNYLAPFNIIMNTSQNLFKLRSQKSYMKQEMIQISRQEYEELKKMTEIDEELLQELVQGLKDIKEGKVIKVK